jgi:tetratricopeptide (TPR) repeat protein
MLPDEWDRIQSVFLSVADLPPDERTGRLDAECGDDKEFRAEVESLLASDGGSAQSISAAIADETALLGDAAKDLAGDRLGAWRVVKEIGRGGMGAVYLAVRDDDQFQKHVAIKVVRHGMDTQDVLGRFRHERQILANMDHPYIARLLDGGTTPDGRPFFVMDYVEGRPLDVFCSEDKPGAEACCRLFLRVLDAVAHAHRNLVVHRDLKPANIFVKSDGTPKLLDFGVAKLLEGDAAAAVTSLDRPFTPQYACPEQVRGFPVTTAVDIYALGAILYEMLTNRRAQAIESLSPSEIERVVCHTEVPRPSLSAPGLDADLDNIVLMAMRKEPARRYQSVDQLAEDVRRYLDGRAILARQDSLWYRTRKFARRNRFQIAAAALIFISLVAALVVTLAQTRAAQSAQRAADLQRRVSDKERARAEQEKTRAEAGFRQAEVARADEAQQRLHAEKSLTQLIGIADKTLFDIHDAVARLPGATEARRVMVKTTLDYLESIQKENGLDDRLRLALGAGYSRIAAIQGEPLRPSLGDAAGALVSYRKAEAMLEPLYARRRDDAEVILQWIKVKTGLAELSFVQTHSPTSVRMYLDLLPAARRLAQLQPSSPQAVKQEAEIEGDLALALQPTNSPAALDHAKRQIAVLTTLTGRFPQDRDLIQDLGESLASAAVPLKDLGSYTDAAESFERSIRTLEPLLEAEPHNAQTQRNLLGAYRDYCELLGVPWSANMGRSAEARSYCEKSVAMARELSGADPRDQTARFDVGFNLAELGMIDPEPNQVADSLRCLEESLRILDPIVRANPGSADIVLKVELVRQYLGLRLHRLGRLPEAADSFRQALAELDTMTHARPGQPSGTAVAVGNEDGLAEVYAEQGDGDAALTCAAKALARAQKYAASHPGQAPATGLLGAAFFELAWVEQKVGVWERASADAEHAASLWRSIGSDHGVLSVHRQARERAEALVREIALHWAK